MFFFYLLNGVANPLCNRGDRNTGNDEIGNM